MYIITCILEQEYEVNFSFLFIYFCISVFAICPLVVCRADDTTTPKTKGSSVVSSAVGKIKNSHIFPDDRGFLQRIARAESNCGNHYNTYRSGYYGGIWQVWCVRA
jgi:hypothetical protein